MNENIDKVLDLMKNRGYDYYYDDCTIAVGALPGGGKSQLYGRRGNCSDEIVKGSHERSEKIRALMNKKIKVGTPHFGKKYGKIINDIHELMAEEHMAITGCSKPEADHFLDATVNFFTVKTHKGSDGKQYISADPKIEPKYKRYQRIKKVI